MMTAESLKSKTKVPDLRPAGRAIFLDRDGTLIKTFSGRPANNVGEVELMPNVVEGLGLLVIAGMLPIVITNQGGIGLGYTTLEMVHRMHHRVDELTGGPILSYYICPHKPLDRCTCRKPLTGMLRSAAENYKIDLSLSQIIGDGKADMEVGVAAGLRGRWLVRTDFSGGGDQFATGVFSNFLEAARAAVALDEMLRP